MVVFTDESAQGNPGPVENGIVISKQGLAGKFLKTCKGSIKLGIDFALKTICLIHIYVSDQLWPMDGRK